MKVRTHLTIMALAILVPVVLFSALVLNMLLAAERQAELRSMQELARASVLAIDQELTFNLATAKTLVTSEPLRKGDFEQFYGQAAVANMGTFRNTVLLQENGQQVFNTVLPFGSVLPPPRPGSRERVAAVLQKNAPQISNLILGAATGKHVISAEVPVTIADGKRFVVSEWIYASRLSEILPKENGPHSRLIALYDRDYRIIARNQNPGQHVGQMPVGDLHKLLQEGRKDVFRIPSRDGIDMYGAIARSEFSGFSAAVGVPVYEIERAARRAVAMTALGLVLATAAALAGAILFSKRIVGAIHGIAQSTKLLGQQKVPQLVTARVTEVDEVHILLHEVGKTLQEIDAARSRHLVEAQQARAQAEFENRAKDEFLAMLGHELRNPLAAISTGASLLKQDGIGPEQKRRAQDIIDRQIGQLSHLIDDLLDAHRVIGGKVTLDIQPVDLGKAVRNYLEVLQPRMTGRHKVRLSTNDAWIEADPTRLDQMIGNLLDNAFKFTPEGGEIDISVQLKDEQAVFVVKDSGTGIAPQYISKIFDVFVQGPRTNRAKGGLGIGLAVVHSLAIQHGATVTVESPGEGLGSTFSIYFPLSSMVAHASTIAASAAQSAKPMKILVIEDNPDAREMLCEVLLLSGHRVTSAENGSDGIGRATTDLPDVALVDIDLPDMSGYEVASKLKSGKHTAKITLIAVTGYGQEADRIKALSAGFDHHMTKPLKVTELLTLLTE